MNHVKGRLFHLVPKRILFCLVPCSIKKFIEKWNMGNRSYPILILFFMVLVSAPARAQDAIAEVIKAGIKKAIKAVDLKIQRLQTKTIWLQNTQKVIENTMAKAHLEEIS